MLPLIWVINKFKKPKYFICNGYLRSMFVSRKFAVNFIFLTKGQKLTDKIERVSCWEMVARHALLSQGWE